MPAALLGLAAISASVFGGGAAITIGIASLWGISAGIGGTILGIAASLGLSYLSSVIFRPKQPKPEDVQSTTKGGTTARVRHYGRVKTSGPLVFIESKAGFLYKVITLGTGRLDAIEELWVDDNYVTVDGSGWVNSGDPYNGDDYSDLRILTRLGLDTETHYTQLEDEFAEWDEDHIGNGVSSLFATHRPRPADRVAQAFPKLAETLYRVVTRGSIVYNIGTATNIWSDNAADIIRDYMTHADGMRLPSSLVTTTDAAAGWLTAYNRATENVSKISGGTEDRYRLWGSYSLNERPGDVLGRMLVSCDGRIVPTPDGGVTVDIGTWAEPTVTLDAATIVGFTDLSRGRDIMTSANIIRATYMSPVHDYQSTDAQEWSDDTDISARGEIAADMSFDMAPSHGQCKRLMKLAAYRANPRWIGTFQCNLKGLAAYGKRFVRITYPLFSIDEVFEVTDFRFDIGDGGTLTGVTLQVQSMPGDAYDWNYLTEEGTAPLYETTEVDDTIPVPTGLDFFGDTINVGGTLVTVGVMTFDAAPAGLSVEIRYKRTADVTWLVAAVNDTETAAQTGALSDGEEYEAQARHVTVTGRAGEWTDSETYTPIYDEVAPQDLVAFSVTGGPGPFLGNVPLAFTTASGDTHLSRIALYRAPRGVTLDKDDHFYALIAGVPGVTFAYTIGDPAPTNLFTEGDFASTGSWTLGADWSIAAGVLTHAAGSSAEAYQSPSLSAGSYRFGVEVVTETTATGGVKFRLGGGTPADSASFGGTGWHFAELTYASNTTVGFIADTWEGDLDNAYVYKETAGSTSAGDWDWYAVPENASGIEGATTAAQRAIVV